MIFRSVCLMSRNVQAMVAFYEKLFGHAPQVEGPDYRFFDEQCAIFALEDDTTPTTEHAALIYFVDDANAEYERQRALGLANGEAPADRPWGVRSFGTSDPDGNQLAFVQPL